MSWAPITPTPNNSWTEVSGPATSWSEKVPGPGNSWVNIAA